MDPALSILDRALKGDAGALNFLESTAAIYVFDGTNPGQPKTCGAWDFLNQSINEIERYESLVMTSQSLHQVVNLEGHLQLLATMTRRAARRCHESDQKLVEICLTNAAHYHGSSDQARQLIHTNRQMRDRVMGRIAAIAFDFAHYQTNQTQQHQHQYRSAFSNPIALEKLCAIVAANAISTGPLEFSNLVTDWIVPSVDNLPPFSVASVTFHLAAEALETSAPVGTRDILKQTLFDPVISKVLAHMLVESVRNSDSSSSSIQNTRQMSHRITAMILKAMERWSAAMNCSLGQIKQICQKVQINIIDTFSDALYSDSDWILDSMAELLETLLYRYSQEMNKLQGISLAGNFLKAVHQSSPSSLHQFEDHVNGAKEEQDLIISELVSAIGLQRFRFGERQREGDTDVCRCLTSIARSIALAAQVRLRAEILHGSSNGLLDLLIQAVSHPSLHVCGIALEAFHPLITPETDVSIRLLPVLQGKAIVPPDLVGMTTSSDCGVDLHEFERLREHLLSEVLLACYISNRSYYIESCVSAIDEFCTAPISPQLPYQLEAALFCLAAISVDASKRALLVSASPAAQAAAFRACTSRYGRDSKINENTVGQDAKRHDELLAKCIRSIVSSPSVASSNPLSLSQMCRFIGKYSQWLSKSPTTGVLDAAAALSLSSFHQATSTFDSASDVLSELSISPFTEASCALRNLLTRAPKRFATHEALAALESGWKTIYQSPCHEPLKINVEDRKALCMGITRVLAVLPSEKWVGSLSVLTNETVECLEKVTKLAEEARIKNALNSISGHVIVTRMCEEMIVLGSILRSFRNATFKADKNTQQDTKGNPILAVLERVWPCLTHIAEHHSKSEEVTTAMVEFLLVAVSVDSIEKSSAILNEACNIAILMLAILMKEVSPVSVRPVLEFVEGAILTYGQLADRTFSNQEASLANNDDVMVRKILETLLCSAFDTAHSKIIQKGVQRDSNIIAEKNSLDCSSGLLSVFTSCAQHCPLLFMSLRPKPGEEVGGIFTQSLQIASLSIQENQADAARSAMLYLKEMYILVSSKAKSGQNVKGQVLLFSIQGGLITSLISGAFGSFPREILDPAANLLFVVLQLTPANVAEAASTSAVGNATFLLGDSARVATLTALGKCLKGGKPASFLMELFEELWRMHDTGGNIASGDAVMQFTKKFGII